MELIIVIFIVGAVAYGSWRLSLRRYPYAPCPKCDGTARNQGSNKQRFGSCRKCNGTGRRKRWGAP